MGQSKKLYATLSHPIIEGITNDVYRLRPEKALELMAAIRAAFIVSSPEFYPNVPEAHVVFWIKGFQITEAQRKDGCTGNYAMVGPEMTDGSMYRLVAKKLDIELSRHPQKKYKKQKHPNWAYPTLREISKGKIFDTVDEAQGALAVIAEDFPDVSILCTHKLYTMIYGKKGEVKSRVHKFVLEVKPHTEGGFIITYKENLYKAPAGKKKKKEADAKQAPEASEETVSQAPPGKGYFTSLVALKRSKKKR